MGSNKYVLDFRSLYYTPLIIINKGRQSHIYTFLVNYLNEV